MNICMKKIGMNQMKVGNSVVGVTFLWCDMLKVLSLKTPERDGYSSMVLGFGKSKIQRWNKPQHYLFKDKESGETSEVPYKIYEYATDNSLEIGEKIVPSNMFEVGSYVDVAGNTIGRGFAGVMKRHNFTGLPATHGVSKAHRKPGSTGQRTYAGRVFKGKKMAGRYGNERVTIQSLKVVFAEEMTLGGISGSVIGVHGAVPGANDSLCFVKQAVKRTVKGA
jgi:large subunit ribosomal protein L3